MRHGMQRTRAYTNAEVVCAIAEVSLRDRLLEGASTDYLIHASPRVIG